MIFLIMIAEIFLLFQMVEALGFLWTLLFCVASAGLGWLVIASTGRNALYAAEASITKRQTPENAVFNTLLVFFGGLLLIVPGPITSLFGLLLVFPLTRPLFRGLVKQWLASRAASGRVFFYNSSTRQGFSDDSNSPFAAPNEASPPIRDVIEVQHKVLPSSDDPGDR